MNPSFRYILTFSLRLGFYAAVMVLLNAIYMHDATHITSTGKFGENSWTEIMQELFLFLVVILFIATGRFNRDLTPVSYLLSVFFLAAFIREFNNQISFWFYLEIPLMILFAVLLYLYRSALLPSIQHILTNRAIPWLVSGLLVTFVFSRFFGRTLFWQRLLESDYNRWAKNAAEEGVELLGYSLLFIAGIEIFIQSWHDRKQAEK